MEIRYYIIAFLCYKYKKKKMILSISNHVVTIQIFNLRNKMRVLGRKIKSSFLFSKIGTELILSHDF